MNARATTAAARGAWAEELALAFLERQGLVALARNYRCRHGEIDLVLRDGNALVFAEVRYRAAGAWVDGCESVDDAKRRRLLASAEHFLQRHREHAEASCRFDVLAVTGRDRNACVDWIRDAFDA